MPERISKVVHQYAGRRLAVGERFECEPQHVALYLARGWIEPEQGEDGYVSREITADGSYLTRDMQLRRRGRPPKSGTQ